MNEMETLARIAALEHKVSSLYRHLGIAETQIGGDASVSLEVQEALAQGNLLQAIKTHREQTGMGLAEAKQQVETYWAQSTAS
jgi:ribosomal protein L7/L12